LTPALKHVPAGRYAILTSGRGPLVDLEVGFECASPILWMCNAKFKSSVDEYVTPEWMYDANEKSQDPNLLI